MSKYFCKVDGCNDTHFCKGLCKRHYWQIYRYGRITQVKSNYSNKGKICKVENCNNPAFSRLYCKSCYNKLYREGKL